MGGVRRRPVRVDGPEAFARLFSVSRETIRRLEIYEGLLQRWQRAVNLVAAGTLREVWHRHFADSAQLARLVPPGATTLVDLGSGAGFPGLVLALVLAERAPIQVKLVESDKRKAAFLREVARQTGVAVEIFPTRIETPETQAKIRSVDVVTARALAPLSRLLSLAAPLFAANTCGLFLKGRDVQREIEEARAGWRFDVELVPSLTEIGSYVAVVRELAVNTEG
jgi:16S rRNA (guanine527-N7)-methyltransferase